MKKRLLTLIVALIASMSLFAFVACGNNSGDGGSGGDKPSVIDYTETAGGLVTFDADEYKKGDLVTLNVHVDYGYELKSFKVDGKTVALTDGKYTFTMPAKTVKIEPEFECIADTKEMPNGKQLSISATAPITGGTATANLFVAFGDESVTVKAYVADERPIKEKDGLRLYFGTNEYADRKVSVKNFAVEAVLEGKPVVSHGTAEGGYVTADEVEGVTVTSEPWSVTGGVACGYIMTVAVDYENLAVTAENAQSMLTVLPYVVNSNNFNLGAPASVSTVDSFYNYANPDTYMTVSSVALNNNRYMFGKGSAGSYKNAVSMGQYWDTSKDYEQGSPEWEERMIVLNGHDNSDNNIAFFGSAGRTNFVKAKFRVDAVHNRNDQFPKFGLMAFDGTTRESGVFFYVSADAKKESDNGVDDIVGTKLGYCPRSSGQWGGWTLLDSTDGAFDLQTHEVTLGMMYKNGFVYMFNCKPNGEDELVAATAYKTSGDVVIGIKCFGLGLTVTDYEITNDPNSELFKTHDRRVDGETIGDNESGYMYSDGWTIVGDMAENRGRGDQVIFIKDVQESKDLYAQANVMSPDKCGNTDDQWTKVGAVLRNDKYLIFGYIDLATSTSAANRVATNFAVFYESSRQWSWEVSISHMNAPVLVESTAANIGIAKVNENIYLLVNDQIVATYSDPTFRNEKFVAGILGMNRHMIVQKGSGMTDVDAIREKLGVNIPDTVDFDGILDDDVWTDTVLNNKLTFNGDSKKGTKIEVVAVKGETGVYAAVTLYTLTEQERYESVIAWNAVPNVAFRFNTITDDNRNDASYSQFVAFYDTLGGAVTSSIGISAATAHSERVTLVEKTANTAAVEGYKTTVEFFIPYRYFPGFNAESEKLPFSVWTYKFDNRDYGAMNSSRYDKVGYVTADGLILEDKAA